MVGEVGGGASRGGGGGGGKRGPNCFVHERQFRVCYRHSVLAAHRIPSRLDNGFAA